MEEVNKTDIEEAFKPEEKTLAQAFDEQEAFKAPAESSTEKEEEAPASQGAEDASSNTADEENTPYHKRWKQREEKLRKEYEAQMEQLKSEHIAKSEETPALAKDLYGDNAEGTKNLMAWKQQIVEEAKAEALRAFKEEKIQYDNAVKQSEAWIDSQLEALKDEGKQFDRNKLLKIVADEGLFDADERWNIKAAYKIYEAMNRSDSEKSNARKRLADSTIAPSKGDTTKKSKVSWEQMRKAGSYPDFEKLGF